MYARRILLAVFLAAAGAAAAVPASGQELEPDLETVEQRLAEAQSRQLHLVSPRHFARAAEKLSEARRALESGAGVDEVRGRLAEAREALSRAEDVHESGSALLREALAAREDALAADATERAPEIWDDAASKLRDAGEELEDGDRGDAADAAAEARKRFRDAELRALEESLLGTARELRRRARDREAHERAPRTFEQADSLLRAAGSLLEADPANRDSAGTLAERSGRGFRHSLRISAVADTFSRDGGAEDLVLRAEAQLERVARRLDLEPRFTEGLAPVTQEVLSAVESLQRERAGLRDEVEGLREELAAEGDRADSLDRRLAQVEEEREEVAARLRERERREETLREVRAIFSPEEAEVLTRGDEMVIRLVELSFEPGSAEIPSEHTSLLTKVRRAIRELPEARITVQGHTDSRGDEEANRTLSQERAIAVREHLLANMAMSADRVTAEGYGETRPIATNDTEEGRAENRRIEIVLEIPEL